MKTARLFYGLILLLFFTNLSAQTTFWTENFEKTNNDWHYQYYQSGAYVNYWNAWKSTNAISGDYSLTIAASDDYGSNWYLTYVNISTQIFAYINIDARGYENLQIQFNWRCGGEIGYDFGAVGYSIDSGANVSYFTSGGYSGGEYHTQSSTMSQTLYFPTLVNDRIFTLLFYWQNDNSGGTDPAFMIDDIVIKGKAISNAPVAYFSPTSTSVDETKSVDFKDQSTNTPTSWQWTFEGGTPATSTAQNPTVTYNVPGTYDVTLKVSNAYGSDTKTVTDAITVNEIAKVTTVSPNLIARGQTLNVTIAGTKTNFKMATPTIYFTNGTDFILSSNISVITNELLTADISAGNYIGTGYYDAVVEDYYDGKMIYSDALKVYDPVGINDNFKNETLSLYPTPFNDKLYIRANFGSEVQFSLKIYDVLGKSIFNYEKSRISMISEVVDVSELKPGVYFAKWNVNGEQYTRKILKQ